MKFDKNKIYVKQLPKQLFNKNIIEGYDSNYEIYLTEFINSSKLINDYNGKFKFNVSQSNGECDIDNLNYGLDFKLFVDYKLMESISLFSQQYVISENKGVIMLCSSKKNGNGIGYNLLYVLANFNYDDIVRIANSEKKNLKDDCEKSLTLLLNNCNIDKNLFFLLPYNIEYKDNVYNDEVVNFLIEHIYLRLENILKYRKDKVNKDTYISFISNDSLIIAKEKDGRLELYDIVSIECSKTYKEILNLTSSLV